MFLSQAPSWPLELRVKHVPEQDDVFERFEDLVPPIVKLGASREDLVASLPDAIVNESDEVHQGGVATDVVIYVIDAAYFCFHSFLIWLVCGAF